MKNIYIFLFLFFIQAGYSQDFIVFEHASKNYPDNQLWTDNQAYQMAESYNIQDSLFLSPETIKERFRLALYMPQEDINKYFRSLREVYDSERYFAEIKNISTIDEWLDLLVKYPGFSNSLINDKVFTLGFPFQEFVNKVKNYEILLFVRGTAIGVVENTPEEYRKFKHLKRLK